MDEGLTRFQRNYAPVLLRRLSRQDEAGLGSAYELGRDALSRSIGLLEVVRVHNETVLEVMGTVRDVEEARAVAAAASSFLIELIASFEMAQRGFMEAQRHRGLPK